VPTASDFLAVGRAILDKADALLQGEPARAIGYGAALVIVGASLASNALGFTRIPAVDLPTAVGLAATAIVTVTGVIESIRKFVYSPATVADIVAEGDTT
jgi:hypothetical protein